MKITVVYNLPEEKDDFEIAHNASKYLSIIDELKTYIRNKLKYEEMSGDKELLLKDIQRILYKEL